MLEIKTIKSSMLSDFKLSDPYETVIVLPATQMVLAKKASEVMKERTNQEGLLLIVEDDLRFGFIMVSNLVYIKTTSRYFGYVAQDAYPGQLWLDLGLEAIKTKNGGLLAFSDGRFFGRLAIFGLADRLWLNTIYNGVLFYPEYKAHYGDTELSVIAVYADKLVYDPKCLLIEVDYEKHMTRNNPDDERLFIERSKAGFDGRVPPFVPG